MTNLIVRRKVPFTIYDVDLKAATTDELSEISRKLSLGLGPEEMREVQQYFTKKGRNPTALELHTIGQTWSEHCFHKTFKGTVHTDDGQVDGLFKTYISKVTDELNLSWCISVFEDNAGIIDFDQNHTIAAKVETHNHPSAIEPFGGAATGVGGVIRDVLGVWADPIACTNVLGFGPLDLDYSILPPGVKHPKYLFRGVVAGIGCYGNNMGIPTVNGAIVFDESYVGNVVVYCGCIGLLPKAAYARHAKPGDLILLAGGRTGRDGIHGVTFASAELTEDSEQVSRPAVQIANPIEEEKLKRAIVEMQRRRLGSGITDLGGGGLSSAAGEMAHRFGCGATIKLDCIPLKHEDLAPWEIYISESQERMLLLIPKENLEQTLKVFREEDVEVTSIGELTEKKTLQIHYHDAEVAHLDVEFLFAPPRTERSAKTLKIPLEEPILPTPKNLTPILHRLLASPNIASKETVIRTYDHEVKGNTALKPLHGEFGGPNDAAVLKPLEESWKGLVISCGINPRYGKISPYWMAASAIDEAIRNNTAVGGRRIALLDNFVWGSPEKPDRMAGLTEACKACYKFAKGFETPFISGKDSLYNESPMGPVTPTLLITAVGIMPDIRRAVSLDFKSPGNPVFAIGQTRCDLGGSEYYRLRGFLGKSVPKVKLPQAKHVVETLTRAVDSGCVRSCHDLSEGGLAVAAAEMAFSSSFGLEMHLKGVPRTSENNREDFLLFSESNSRFLVEVPESQARKFREIARDIPHGVVGRVTADPRFRVYGLGDEKIVDVNTDEMLTFWRQGVKVTL